MGYDTLAQNRLAFKELGQLPKHIHLDRFDDASDLQAKFLQRLAVFHRLCHAKYKAHISKRKGTNNTIRTSSHVQSCQY